MGSPTVGHSFLAASLVVVEYEVYCKEVKVYNKKILRDVDCFV